MAEALPIAPSLQSMERDEVNVQRLQTPPIQTFFPSNPLMAQLQSSQGNDPLQDPKQLPEGGRGAAGEYSEGGMCEDGIWRGFSLLIDNREPLEAEQ